MGKLLERRANLNKTSNYKVVRPFRQNGFKNYKRQEVGDILRLSNKQLEKLSEHARSCLKPVVGKSNYTTKELQTLVDNYSRFISPNNDDRHGYIKAFFMSHPNSNHSANSIHRMLVQAKSIDSRFSYIYDYQKNQQFVRMLVARYDFMNDNEIDNKIDSLLADIRG